MELMRQFILQKKVVFGVAKNSKLTLYFTRNDENFIDKIIALQNEFPEVKIIKIDDENSDILIYYTIRYPIKIRESIFLYLDWYNINFI